MRFILFALPALLCLSGINSERQEKSLDRDGKYVMGWDVDTEKGEIIFDVKVETQGYVGFGLNQKADMANADIVIGGVDAQGTPYFADYHAVGKETPILDESQDWTLLEAVKNTTHVSLKFKRELNTCDDVADFLITKDTVTVIWSFGETDEIKHHIARGSNSINFLDPLPPPIDLEDDRITKWGLRVNDPLPPVHTSYLCSFHKFDAFPMKHHAIGMNVFLENDRAVKHTHHFAAFNCIMDDMSSVEEQIGKPALNCEDMRVLTEFKPNCRDMLFGWGAGGQLVLLPEHVGIPVMENEVYYVMLEIHYDNPLEETGIQFTTGFDAYFSTELRENEGSIVMVGARILPSLIIPPDSENFVMAGHCSSEITSQLIPPGGVNIVSVNAHSHLAGRKMRVRHFRDGKELPWLFDDQNYDFNYQQTRTLGQEVKWLPGDHLTTECTYDTTFRDEITLAGESTRDEMCHAFIFFYPKIRLNICSSGIPLEFVFQAFGVEGIDNSSVILDPIITKPDFLANQTFSELLNDVDWTIPRRVDLEQKLRFNRHEAYYELIRNTNDSFPYDKVPVFEPRIYTKYPEIDEDYAPEIDTKCIAAVTGPTTDASDATPAATTEGNNSANGGVFMSCTFLLFSLVLQVIL